MQLVLTIVLVVQLLAALVMIGLVLIQHGKGADMGASFGSGSSGSLFGATGSANFLSRSTGVCAAIFFACTLALAYFGNLRNSAGGGSLLERAATVAPAASTPASMIPGVAGSAASAPAASSPAASAASTAPATPSEPASGAAQIPTK